MGFGAGFYATTGSHNIFIGSLVEGAAADANLIRIGGAAQNKTFIAGIRAVTTGAANALTVLIDSAGQLGTVSSSGEVKQDIRDLGDLSDRLLALRPVAFRYKQHVASDPDAPLDFGLIAEEVAQVFPELVVYDEAGRLEAVKYHLLSALLVNELQDEHAENLAQRGQLALQKEELTEQRLQLAAFQRRLAALEEGRDQPRPRRTWLRRRE